MIKNLKTALFQHFILTPKYFLPLLHYTDLESAFYWPSTIKPLTTTVDPVPSSTKWIENDWTKSGFLNTFIWSNRVSIWKSRIKTTRDHHFFSLHHLLMWMARLCFDGNSSPQKGQKSSHWGRSLQYCCTCMRLSSLFENSSPQKMQSHIGLFMASKY